jgi:hypothetical protein
VGEYEADVPEACERAGKQQVCNCSGRVLRDFRNERRYIRNERPSAMRDGRVHKHHCLAPIEFFENGDKRGVSHPLVTRVIAIARQQANSVRLEYVESVFDLAQTAFRIG